MSWYEFSKNAQESLCGVGGDFGTGSGVDDRFSVCTVLHVLIGVSGNEISTSEHEGVL